MNVLLDYFKTFKLLQEWGVSTRVAWWGQCEKENHLDATGNRSWGAYKPLADNELL